MHKLADYSKDTFCCKLLGIVTYTDATYPKLIPANR